MTDSLEIESDYTNSFELCNYIINAKKIIFYAVSGESFLARVEISLIIIILLS